MFGEMNQPRKIANFQHDLAYSVNDADEPYFDAFYRFYFPYLVRHEILKNNCREQRDGVDRRLHFPSGHSVIVQEKRRRADYGDVLLEYESNDNAHTKGWIEKFQTIDYWVYAIMPTKRFFIYPWCALVRVWEKWGPIWKRQYKTFKSDNGSYNTLFICVPFSVLHWELRGTFCYDAGAFATSSGSTTEINWKCPHL